MRLASLLTALAVTVAGAGCATKGDVTSLQRSMNAHMDSMQATQDSLLGEMQRLRSALVQQEEESASLTRTRTSELERRIGDLREQVAQLTQITGQTQRTLQRQLDRLSSGARSGGGAGGVTVGGGAADSASAGDDAPADTAAGDTASTGGEGTADSPESLYKTGVQQFRRGAYETARIALEKLLSAYPRHDLAPDAQFFLARTYRDAGEARRALEEFQRILELYPNSGRASAALYQRGMIHVELGNTDEARSAFEQVLRGYPDSPEAELAEERLSELGGG